MKVRDRVALGGITVAALGTGLAARALFPQRLPAEVAMEPGEILPNGSLPKVDVTFLRCGRNVVPASLAVRGKLSLASRTLAYSAVLVRHPRGTFLYDTGLCADIQRYLRNQPLWFRSAFSALEMESPIGLLLQQQGLKPQDLDFILLSHLHWDHVSGIPDLPNVPLRIHRVEYNAVPRGIMARHQGMVKSLLCDNPIELFDLSGPAYAGFPVSYDLFGDGSILLIPLPGHTDGQVGMLISRANGTSLFLIADAAWLDENYLIPAPMHPFVWSILSSDRATALDTLLKLHHFARRYPEIPLIAMHDASTQAKHT